MNENLKQRREILEYLQQNHSLSTLYARDVMGIMHPGGRVLELRKSGYNIVTNWRVGTDAASNEHRTAEYILMTGQPDQVGNQQQTIFQLEA